MRLRRSLWIGVAAVVLVWLLSGGIIVMDYQGYTACPPTHGPGRDFVAEIRPEVVRNEIPWGVSGITGGSPFHVAVEANVSGIQDARRLVIQSIRATLIDEYGHEEIFEIDPPSAAVELTKVPIPTSHPTRFYWHVRENIAKIGRLDRAKHVKCRLEIEAVLSSDLMVEEAREQTIHVKTQFCRTSHWEVLPFFLYKSRTYED